MFILVGDIDTYPHTDALECTQKQTTIILHGKSAPLMGMGWTGNGEVFVSFDRTLGIWKEAVGHFATATAAVENHIIAHYYELDCTKWEDMVKEGCSFLSQSDPPFRDVYVA
jgi:hypothetical protein